MKKGAVMVVALLMLGPQVTKAQTPASPSTGGPKPQVYRYGSISGSWLSPSGDFSKIANDGWAITLEGFQFLNPTKKIAVGSQVGYQSFGKKNGVGHSNFPVDAVLKFFPKPGSGKADLYGTGGIGFNDMRTDFSNSSSSDYFFGTQAGAGVELHGKGPASLVVDAVYHWVFSTGTSTNFVALRGGILVPMMR